MTYRVIVLPSAELDITNAAAWIADHSPASAASWLEGPDAFRAWMTAAAGHG